LDRPEIYFLHIEKTAGSSLASLIRRAYPQQQAIPVYECPALANLNREQINNYRCYTGHFGTSLYSLLDREIPTITVLRDPFERAISHLLHGERLNEPSTFVWGLVVRAGHWLWDTIENDEIRRRIETPVVGAILRDYQTRTLGVDIDLSSHMGKPIPKIYALIQDAEVGQNMDSILERAKKRLDAMAVVGIVERFDDTVRLVCNYLGIPVPDVAPVMNVAPGHAFHIRHRDSGLISPDLAALIDRITVYDRELYEYARKLMNARLQDVTNRDAL